MLVERTDIQHRPTNQLPHDTVNNPQRQQPPPHQASPSAATTLLQATATKLCKENPGNRSQIHGSTTSTTVGYPYRHWCKDEHCIT
eukprot:917328-Amphidinium_carterae.1